MTAAALHNRKRKKKGPPTASSLQGSNIDEIDGTVR